MATLLTRTPGSVAFKLVNFASLDPRLQERGIVGAKNAGNLTEQVWADFYNNWDRAFEQSENLLSDRKQQPIEQFYNVDISDIPEVGLTKRRMVNTRVNQYRFRKLVMTNYNFTCCITGIQQPELLVASHITSWSKFENNRLNPRNGICLNALHDKAFDNKLLTITANDF